MIATERPRTPSRRIVDVTDVPDCADDDDLVDVALDVTGETRARLFGWDVRNVSHDVAVVTLMTD